MILFWPLCRMRLAVILAALAMVLFGQTAGAETTAVSPPDPAKQRQELETLLDAQREALDAERKLRREVEAIGEDRRKLNEALIDQATRLRSIEARMTVAEDRLARLAAEEAAMRESLDRRRNAIAEVLAALQRIGRRPLPAVLARAEDALESVRAAIALGAALPEMTEDAKAVAGDLQRLTQLRGEIAAERDKLARDATVVEKERQRMSLLVDERRKRQESVEKALSAERQRAAELARQTTNLKDLIARLEGELDSAGRAARNAARSTPRGRLDAFKDAGRLAPAIAFADARGRLPLPVNGVKVRDFGAADGSGGTEKGLILATRGGAQVTSPCDGWVVYAGAFRSYGQLLIINAGGGYHVVLAGMDRISAEIGQFVLTGEPVAVMGDGPRLASVIGVGVRQPVLYIEFRKDGAPFDPSPWWTSKDNEKVRG